MMVELIRAPTRVEAWAAATQLILAQPEETHLILDIERPQALGPREAEVHKRLDEIYTALAKPMPVNSVAETIFPAWEYKHNGLEGVFKNYPEQYEAMKSTRGGWGTYAHRMIMLRGTDGKPLRDEEGEIINPLKKIIEKMRISNSGERSAYGACYELNIYRAELDRKPYYGLPCLSHLSFKFVDGKVHLTAVYRSHDYAYKVPGNLLGLARLQACVAHEVGAPIGHLIIHSTRAFIDGDKRKMREIAAIALASAPESAN